jgi:hypothetical protein
VSVIEKATMQKFQTELTGLLKQHEIDFYLQAPDYVLASHLVNSLRNLETTIWARDNSKLKKAAGASPISF